MRRWGLVGAGGAVGLALVVGLVLPGLNLGALGGGPTSGPVTGPGEVVEVQASPHIPAGQRHDGYNTNPPSSGPHTGATARYGFHETAVPRERVLHNVEHGAVAVWYRAGEPDLAGRVEEFARGLPGFPTCMVVTPYEDMESPVALTAWGRILKLDAFDASQMQEFVAAYAGQVGNGQEAGLCRQES